MDLEEKIAGEIVISDDPGSTMRKWREEFKITQQELGKYMGISPSVISDYELGRRKSPGLKMIRKFVLALIAIDIGRGGEIVKKFKKNYGSDAIIDIREFWKMVTREELTKIIDGNNLNPKADMKKPVYGYTMIDSIKAIIEFNSNDYIKIYGWSNERALIFTGVKYGRSPMVAIRAHPLKPGMVVFARPENVDSLSIKLAELEGLPLIITKLEDRDIIKRLRDL
ncbi:MAG: helix-turn-helix domain-containing protein [Thermoplasmata archaeon]|jgi:putative transcriptional regulator|nr:helix-turn-helix domain-containing protein [Euryarchaeota archaeon]MVT14172.1 helix-turn-helix domain-containing protein [Euryarchaeota archaeon]MVT36384.1 helix-turn-helix domain-containing protein [Euryarchaeota archaeon]